MPVSYRNKKGETKLSEEHEIRKYFKPASVKYASPRQSFLITQLEYNGFN